MALGSLSIERGAFAQSSDTIKVALVGCGGRGSGAANQALSTAGDVKLVAMADAFKDRMDGSLKGLQKNHGLKADVKEENKFIGFDAYKKAISMADMVILATPPGFRPIHFAEAIKQGKNVFMEKPVAVDGKGVRQVLAAAAEAKKKKPKGRRWPAAPPSAWLSGSHQAHSGRSHRRYRLRTRLLERRRCLGA